MTGDNFLSVIRSEIKDPNLLYLFDVTLGMELAGYSTDEVITDSIDGIKSARSLIATAKHFDLDACNGSVMWFDNRIFGNKITVPKKGIPYNIGFALSDPNNFESLDNSAIPKELLNELVLSHQLVSESTECALVNHTPSPLGAASSLRGLQNILMDMLLEPDFVSELLAFSSETTRIIHDSIADEVNIDLCLISGAYDNVDLIGSELLNRFSIKPLENTLNFISKDETVCFHPHGTLSAPDAKDIVRTYQDLGIDCLYYGEYNEPHIIHEYAPKMSLMGGIDTFTTIVIGDTSRVKEDTERCIKDMTDCSYVFSCSCSVDRGLPIDRLETMCRTVKSFTSS